MAFSFLDTENIYRIYESSRIYTEVLTRPFKEYERIARNRPHENIDPAYPKTTDGTTASIVRKTPKRIVQQLPSGRVVTDDEGWLGVVADFIYNKKILPYANSEYSLIQKSWLVIENALTFGSTPVYTPFLKNEDGFGPDMTIPYWGDVKLQKGKKSGESCSYLFMRSWWQKADIENLIESETKLSKKPAKGKATYVSTWDIPALQKVLDAASSKDAIAQTPSERERGVETTAIELITGFQKGIGAKFYTFNPASKQVVRTKTNQDPRGKIPIDWMYGDIDGTNPLGRGIVELIGGLQNLIDSDMQMYQFNRALALAPPVIKYGNLGAFKYAPNVVVNAHNDPNAKIVPLVIDTTAIANYPALYGLQKSQLLNLVNSPDTSISSEIGNPSFSKTPAGVKSQQATVSVDDNYVRKMFERFFQDWSETALNLYFAEHHGIEEIQLDKATAMKLREMPNFDQNLLSPENKIRIDYDTDTPLIKFLVDPTTSTVQDKAAQVQDAMNLLDIVMKYPMLNSNFGGPIDVEVLARRIVNNSGIEDPEQVAPEPTPAQIQSKEQQKNTVNPFSPMYDKPQLRINSKDLSPEQLNEVLSNAGIHTPPPQQGQQQEPQSPAITLADIYKTTTDPTIKAQIEQMAGLQPNPQNVQNQVETNAAQHTADQVNHLNNAANALMPQNPQSPNQAIQQEDAQELPQENQQEGPEQISDLDKQLIQHLQALGLPPQLIQKAIEMAEQGASVPQILQAIGVSNGQ